MTGPVDAVLGHAAGDVRVMMLHGDERQVCARRPTPWPTSGEIAGMQIVDDGLGLDLEGAHQVGERLRGRNRGR